MARAHCWKGAVEDIEERYGFHSPEHIECYLNEMSHSTCMLWENHKGPHVWTFDGNIEIRFAANNEVSAPPEGKE